MSNFISTDRKTAYLLPPSVDGRLNEGHLARFVVEMIDGLNPSNLTRQYAERGSKVHHPATLLAILVYGYAIGLFASRKLERATYDRRRRVAQADRRAGLRHHQVGDGLSTVLSAWLAEGVSGLWFASRGI